eukprot:326384-Pyramimonas_sp.AAC.1
MYRLLVWRSLSTECTLRFDRFRLGGLRVRRTCRGRRREDSKHGIDVRDYGVDVRGYGVGVVGVMLGTMVWMLGTMVWMLGAMVLVLWEWC